MTTASSTRSIALCIFCFLASCLVTLSVRSSQQSSGSFIPSFRNRYGHISSSSLRHQQSSNPAKVAFATFLAGNSNPDADPDKEEDWEKDGYFIGARVLAYQLLHSRTAGTNASIPFIVLCTRDVSAAKRERLRLDGATVVVAEKLKADWVVPGAARWADVMAKLRLFQLTQYNKICFIDADMLVTANLDGVFYDEATLTQPALANLGEVKEDEGALPRTYMFATHADFWGYDHPYPPHTDSAYMNVGFFVFTPSSTLFDYYTSLLKLPGRFDPGFPEQNLLNYAHRREGNMPWKPLWYGWNVNWPTEKDWKGGAKSFHAKYWDGDPSHDVVLKQIWERQRSEMEGYYRGRELRW